MKAITAKRVLMVVIAVFSMSLMFGCANMGTISDSRSSDNQICIDAYKALDQARMNGKDERCPEEFNALKDRIDADCAAYRECRDRKALDDVQAAVAELNAFCPRKQRAAVAPVVQPAPKPAAKVLVFREVHFDFDKSTLTPEAQAILKGDAQILKDNPKTKVRIAGYASASGTEEYNQKLSERRARAVEDFLINEGIITPDRLTRIGYGEDRPEEHETTPSDINSEAARANMRVTFEIIEE